METKDFVLGYGAGKNSAVSEKIVEEVDAWLDEHITNPDSPPLDRSLTSSSAAAPADMVGDINDEVGELRNTLNHKADVIYDTASGDIASFPDGADGLPVKDLTVAIEPVQSGTGDPSPTNVRPISGWTGCNVTRTGKNLANPFSSAYAPSINTGELVPYSCWRTDFIQIDNTKAYMASKILDNAGYILFYSETQEYLGYINFDGNGTQINTYSKYSSAKYIKIRSDGTSDPSMQLELGSTKTDYEQYQGTTIPISWQSEAGTVYGGTLDVTSGALTVDRAEIVIDGVNIMANGIATYGENHRANIAYPSGKLPKYDDQETFCISDKMQSSYYYVIGSADVAFDGVAVFPHSSALLVNFSSSFGVSTVQEANTWFASNTPTVVYPLATPIEITLDPVTVNTLLGQNNVWADCGPSTVEYPADTKLYIQKINTPTDDDMIADAQIASGKYFIVNNNLYLSTTTILAGDPIKSGTNCTLTNLAAALNAINS